MPSRTEDVQSTLVGELAAVAQAAGERLRAETDGDRKVAKRATQELMRAATSAMAAGLSLSDITHAEALGQEAVRASLCGDTLRSVERSGRRAREARREHHQAIARAMRLGLSTRQIADAAGVTHGTVRAITNRLSTGGSDGQPALELTDDN